MSGEPWTIERICDALGSPALSERFLAEINRTPAPELLTVFAKWQQVAEDTLTAAERGRGLADYDARGEEAPGEWIDVTERVQDEAARIRDHDGA